MFESHFGLRENPFVAAHQTRYIYPSPEHQEALAHLRFGIENREPFVLITGEVGTGKTTALFDALSEWEDRAVVGLITNSSLTRAELLEEIALRLGLSLPAGASKPQIMVGLEQHLRGIHAEGHRAILLLDEAQNLERELLEEIRLLSNLEANGDKLVQIFLVGQPELEGRLGRPELRQLRQRIAVHYRLRPLGAADSERYIHHRIAVAGGHGLSVFPPDACQEVHRLTNGIPREMNHLCSQAMITAFVEGAPAVHVDHVRSAAQELEFQSVLGKERRTRNIATPVERRQTPTVHGAAPPPERLEPSPPPPALRPAPRPEAAAPAPPPAAPPARATEPPPRASAPASPEPPAPAAEPRRWEPEPFEGDNSAESGPPAWTPPQAAPPREAAPAPRPAPPPAHEPAAESGPPRLEDESSSASGAAPAASGDDWQSWFKSLTSEAESAVGSADALPDDDDDAAGDPGLFADEADADDAHDLPGGFETPAERTPPRTQAEPAAPARPEPAAPAAAAPPSRAAEVQPAASSSAFAEALRRAEARQQAADAQRPAPAPRVPRRLTPEDTPLHALPPRLRAKMEAEDGSSREPSRLPLRLMIAAGLLAVVLVGALLAQRFLFAEKQPAAGTAETVGEPRRAPAADPVPEAATPAPPAATPPAPAVRREPPPATTATTPARPAPPPATRTAPADAPAPAKPQDTTTYALSVGTYLNEERAREEVTKLGGSSALASRVTTVQEDNVAMYRVMMGSFTTRAAAERAASDLIARGLVDEARIVPLKTPAP